MEYKDKILKNALISVYNKKNIVEFAKILIEKNIKIFSTKNTEILLNKNKIHTNNINQITQYDEILNGQIKTLHPKIFGGILWDRKNNNSEIKKYKIKSFDIIIINFYPFSDCQKRKNIDIGGPSMVRAAIKNYKNIAVITDILDYDKIISELNNNGYINNQTKLKLAIKALEYIHKYDFEILKYLNQKNTFSKEKNNIFPKNIYIKYKKYENLKYGENPHQKSALYIPETHKINKNNINFKEINNKKLSYNNLYDAYIAFECVNQFDNPACVIIKHGNPCGASVNKNILLAYQNAYNSDSVSAFGGIIGFNKIIDEKTICKIIKNQFVEVIIGPNITPDALKIIEQNKKIKIIISKFNTLNIPKIEFHTIYNNLLAQEYNTNNYNENNWTIVSKKKPTELELQYALFAWKIVKFVKSNGIVYSHKFNTISIGAGQTNRIESVKIANFKYYKNEDKLKLKNKKIIMSSDGFFPFKDSIVECSYINNISCIIQPGGSIRDQEIINTADKYNIAMIFTHQRNFKH